MRILVVSDRYPPYYTGGYEIACQAVNDELVRRGHEVVVLTSNYGLGRRTSVDGNVHRVLHRPEHTPSMVDLARWHVADRRALRRMIQASQPDVIYAWCLRQLFPFVHQVLARTGLPLVYELQDVWLPGHLEFSGMLSARWLEPGSSLPKRFAKGMVKSLVRVLDPGWLKPVTVNDLRLDHLVFCSNYQRERHVASALPLGDHQVIYNGLDLSRFEVAPTFDGSAPLRILFVGRLVKEKGAHVAVRALAQLTREGRSDVELSIAGVPAPPFEYERELRAVVAGEGIGGRVRFLGMVPNEELPEVYRQHHVLLFPSAHREGLPVTLLEAMASGLAVVATETGGSAEMLVDGVNALVVPAEDSGRLARSIQSLRESPQRLRGIALAGRRWVETNGDIRRIGDHTAAYLETVARRASPAA